MVTHSRRKPEGQKGSKSWIDLKARLIKRGFLDAAFKGRHGNFLPSRVVKRGSGSNEYEPLLFDNHLRDLSGHLDRVLSYRREMRELEIQAVKAAAEYQLFTEQSPLDLEIETLRLRKKEKEILARSQREAAARFGNGSDLAAGSARAATGMADQYDQELKDAQAEIDLLAKKSTLIAEYQNAYHLRHEEKGNAHNYGDRARQLGRILQQDLDAAAAKAAAMKIGFQMIYGKEAADLPKTTSVDFIDDLVIWVRDIIEEVEFAGESEAEYDLVVPLHQPTASGGTSLVDDDVWKAALEMTDKAAAPFSIGFTLPKTLFRGTNIRIRRIGLAYGTKVSLTGNDLEKAATFDAYARYRASITTPPQSRPDRRSSYKRPAVFLGMMTVYGAPLAYSEGAECLNLNPFGQWKIDVDPVPVSKDVMTKYPQGGMLDGFPWVDLKIYLRVRARIGS